MSRRSKEKGNEFEWLIAKTLSAWMHPEGDKKELIRSVASGGWSERERAQAGDLAANGPHGELFRKCFAIECKHWKEVNWWHVFSAPKSELVTNWHRILREAEEHELIALYVLKQNHMPIVVCFPGELETPPECFERVMHVTHLNMKVVLLEDFLSLEPDWYYDAWYPSCRG